LLRHAIPRLFNKMAKSSHSQPPFGTAQNRLCAVVAAPTARDMIAQIGLALPETRTIELRLDWMRSDSERSRFLTWLKRHRPQNATFLATCRRVVAGGKFRSDIQAELFWLIQARDSGCLWCDLEIETLGELPDQSIREYAVPPRVLLSEHDFEHTPHLPHSLNPPAHGEADAVKIAAYARSIADSVRLLRLARHSHNFVAVPMGEVGLPARILALREGSALAYAPVSTPTAPGQVSLREMKHLYRAHKLTRRTAVYAVIGNPIAHSLSPLLHNTGFIASNLDAVMLPFLVRDLRDFLKAIPEFGIRGFAVTIPHKRAIVNHLDECDPLTARMGAVNSVLVRRDGSLFGCNTDFSAVLRALEPKLRISGSRILILGAGGSARSAAFALADAGAEVFICSRRESAARALSRAAACEAIPRRALRTEHFDAILNATPVGMYPHDSVLPLAPDELHCRIVMDFIYRPMHTKLLRLAAKKRIATVSGMEMFLAQGFAQWRLWTGRPVPEAAVRRTVLRALSDR
jgi:3-dehydroquinate dehydratase / shikimate dehydrogenase